MRVRLASDVRSGNKKECTPIDRRRFVGLAGSLAILGACSPQSITGTGQPRSKYPNRDETGASSVANVRDSGASGDGATDDTAAFARALALFGPEGGTLTVPDGIYLIDPVQSIRLQDNLTLELAPGAVLQAIPVVAHRSGVIHIENARNVRVTGGNIVGEREGHLGTGGEGGHGIRILGSSDITIENVVVTDCWGDGIYVARSAPYQPAAFAKNLYSERITIRKCIARNNRRQGLSIVACIGALVEDSEFTDTNGTLPQSGIDLEPNRDCTVTDITIRNCLSARNAGYGILVCGNDIYGGTLARVTIEQNRCRENALAGSFVLRGSSEVRLATNILELNQQHGIMLQRASNNEISSNVLCDNSQARPGEFPDIYLESAANENIIEANRSNYQRRLLSNAKPSIKISSDCVGNIISGGEPTDRLAGKGTT